MALKQIAIDTNIAIELLNGNEATLQLLSQFDIFNLPITVCGELLFGAINSRRVNANLDRYLSFISTCKILDVQMQVASEYASIKFNLRQTGRPIPENDIWIAAICSSYDIPLLTRDQHFSYIDSLQIIG